MSAALPVYARIKRDLRDAIASGQLVEGAPVPSENELSEQYGASRHQTRQALRELELEGYLLRSQGKRSVVAPPLQRTGAFPLNGKKTVAIALQTQSTHYERGIYDGIQSVLSERKSQSIAYSLLFDEHSEVEFLRHVRGLGVAGLITWLQHPQSESRELLRSFRDAHFPVVLIDRDLPGLGLDSVTTDNRGAGKALTQQLIARGHRKIGFLSDIHHADSGQERFLGYREALEEAGLPCRETFFAKLHVSAPDMQEKIKAIMSYRERPTAFTCIHELFIKELTNSLNLLGFQVPRDVELAAIADEGMACKAGVPIIGARQQAFEIGRRAAEVLFARISRPDVKPIACRIPAMPFDDANDATPWGAESGETIHFEKRSAC